MELPTELRQTISSCLIPNMDITTKAVGKLPISSLDMMVDAAAGSPTNKSKNVSRDGRADA